MKIERFGLGVMNIFMSGMSVASVLIALARGYLHWGYLLSVFAACLSFAMGLVCLREKN